ncbi:MAG: tail completion protein gp17, partial [Acidimicrobiales bacterium]
MTALSPELAIQEAIFERASGDPGLEALDAGVFDFVPEGQRRPYVVVGEMFSTPDNAHGT